MSATNSTANYSLPIFVSSDVPSWLTDWNGAMGDIDSAIAAAKATADSALLASGNNTADITTIQGQITTINGTLGTHTTQIGTISGNINTINSLIGNGTPTTTDQTLIGAINELHANQGDLANLTTTDKSSLVAAINEVAGGGSTSPVTDAKVVGTLGTKTVYEKTYYEASGDGNHTATFTIDAALKDYTYLGAYGCYYVSGAGYAFNPEGNSCSPVFDTTNGLRLVLTSPTTCDGYCLTVRYAV